MSIKYDEAKELVDLAKQKHLKLQVGHVVRFDHRFQAAEKLIQSPQLIECTRTSGYTFRSMDVGVTLDLMIHDLDLVLSLVDSPVESVQAIGTAVIGPHEDIAHARLTFSNGAIANLTASRVSFDQVRKLEATGRFGFVSVDFLKEDTITALSVGPELQSLDIDPTNMPPAQQQQISDRFFVDLLPKAELPVKPTNAIAEEHQDFYTAITEDRTPVVSGATGERVLNVAARIVNTIKSGSTNEPTEIGGPHFSQDGESFKDSLTDPDELSVIAEIKRKSPSAGSIADGVSAIEQARSYLNADANALSVLTDSKYFGGELEDLWEVNDFLRSHQRSIPTLRKDFMIHPIQVLEALEAGARAILLIVRALGEDDLKILREAADLAGLDCLYEIHEEKELEKALKHDPEILGVNNRDLARFTTDLETTENLFPLIPEGIVKVSESGIVEPEDAWRVREAGADAILCGETLMRAEDPEALIHEMKERE